MIKKIVALLILLLFVILFPKSLVFEEDDDFSATSQIFKLDYNQKNQVDYILSNMTIEEKCGQLVIPFAYGKDSTKSDDDFKRLKHLADDYFVGGFMFLQGNIENQTAIINNLQKSVKHPLLFSSDFERGVGMRLEDGVAFPSSMAVAAANDTTLTYYMGKVIGLESRALGIHQNYAPILDINHDPNNPIINTRAYSDNRDIVSKQSKAFIDGMHQEKLLTTAKHFPGHGATDTDSHAELPLISLDINQLNKDDLVPFRQAIASHVKSVMVGHLSVPAYEFNPDVPATLSKNIVTGLLKQQMQFSGLIITDAMNMSAITDNFTPGEAAVNAILAGNDLILFPIEEEETIDALVSAVQKKIIPLNRINYSVRKLITAKVWLGLYDNHPNVVNRDEMYTSLHQHNHWRLAEEIAEKSVTLLKDNDDYLPVDPNKYHKTALITMLDFRYRKGRKHQYPFEKFVFENFKYVKNVKVDNRDRKSTHKKALKVAKQSDLVIMPMYVTPKINRGSINLTEKQLDLVRDIIKLDKPVVVVSLGSPYLIGELPEAKCYLATYGSADISEKAAVNAILGKTDIGGILPVSVPEAGFIVGDGIYKESDGLWFQKENADTNYNFEVVDKLMQNAVNDKVFPGGVLLVGQRSKVIYHKAFGRHNYDANSQKITTESIFDLASLTKVVATTPAAMILVDQRLISLDEKVGYYLPEFTNNGKENITIRNLLLHNSGLPSWKPFYKMGLDSAGVVNAIMTSELESKSGETYRYSDLGMITMQKVVERVTGVPYPVFLKNNLYDKLEMNHTCYNPPADFQYFTVPTEEDNYWRHKHIKGSVHDESAASLNGVAGHAGLFSRADDIAKYAYTILNDGKYKKQTIFYPNTVRTWTSKQSAQSSRGLGWDTKSEGYSSAGSKFSLNSCGHTGFTGTSIWIDKDRDLFVILLTNRVNPTRENKSIIKFRPKLHDAIIDAVDYF